MLNVDFSSSFLTKVSFQQALISNTNFDNSVLLNINFKNTSMRKVKFNNSKLKNVSFNGTSADLLDFSNSKLENVDFKDIGWASSIDLSNTKFIFSNFDDILFVNSNLIGADFGETDFIKVSFINTLYSEETKWPSGYDFEKLNRLRRNKELICTNCKNELNIHEVEYKSGTYEAKL